jgi:outer membrane protein OmpA-like peptidoglycan-associated protein
MNNRLRMICLAIAVLIPGVPAQARTLKDTVNSVSSKTVVSTSGECVRTKWSSVIDACEPKPAPAPAPKPMPVATIEKDQRTVYFDFNKDTLRTDAVATLDQLTGLIRVNGTVTSIHVVGFADPIGGESQKNLDLSQRRAEAVRKYLASMLQIPSDASVKGLGVSHTAECKDLKNKKMRIGCLQPDRRVEVELTYRVEPAHR